MVAEAKFSVGRVTRFYVPLLLQGFSQSLSYPLVAGVVTHGSHGVYTLIAVFQAIRAYLEGLTAAARAIPSSRPIRPPP